MFYSLLTKIINIFLFNEWFLCLFVAHINTWKLN
jgi:hypothetical protein